MICGPFFLTRLNILLLLRGDDAVDPLFGLLPDFANLLLLLLRGQRGVRAGGLDLGTTFARKGVALFNCALLDPDLLPTRFLANLHPRGLYRLAGNLCIARLGPEQQKRDRNNEGKASSGHE